MPAKQQEKDRKSIREAITRSMIASFRIEGIHITPEVAARLLQRVELRLEGSRG